MQRFAVGRVQWVVFGCELDAWANLHVILNRDTANIQKGAVMVDEDVFPETNKSAKCWCKTGGKNWLLMDPPPCQ